MAMQFLASFVGGCLIGLAATVLLIGNGRVAGISGILGGLVARDGARLWINGSFVVGLLLGPPVYRLASGAWPAASVTASLPLLIIGGLLVGFGTRLGSGCTSGHGVVGLARLSPRSIAAVITFMVAAVATVFLMRVAGLS
ncbi:YeeE/YedE thiosulfate transporter family protein [Methylocella sp. CPCC 101449]|uniref:YeeE/YedE family protein n=1 Tax=Methylocella sp. CPCC 101449 TaxID=2987531 RepID=UPI00288CD9D4|nr:YeeE/YedE thiosulfate transporter family protein [Methylocella sp. CPCC 101449]MDT2021852.1 YeeE/YedE thiosulfate transporter family protein [Methylocella sp. CPCC 101449]